MLQNHIVINNKIEKVRFRKLTDQGNNMSGDQTKDAIIIQMQTPSRQVQFKDATITTRAPPLDIHIQSEVIVVNGDRSSLTWKKYTLIDINPRNGMCVVEGSDTRQRNFPRPNVKPKDWVDKLRALFHAIAAAPIEETSTHQRKPSTPHSPKKKTQGTRQYVEYHNFYNSCTLLGAQYDDEHALKIFRALDVRANGLLSFSQWLNWMYGLGRVPDKGRLLTTIECLSGLRKWSNTLTYSVMMSECKWSIAKYDKESSTPQAVHVVPMQTNAAATVDTQIPRNLDCFVGELNCILLANVVIERYSPSDRECFVVVMGPGEIGKTALINKFVKGVFPHDYDPTIQDHSRKAISVSDETTVVDIVDTAGQDEFASMRYDWLRSSVDVLLICFSRTDHESFIRAEELINIAKRLLKQHKRIVPILLVATKTDLLEEVVEQVTRDDVEEFQKRYAAIEYCECSAFMDENVSEVFTAAVGLYRKWRDSRQAATMRKMTDREVEQKLRRDSYVQNMARVGTRSKTKCVSCLAKFCPAFAAVLEDDEVSSSANKLLSIASVPKDKFGDELAEPSYSKQHFFVERELSCKRLFYCILTAIFFPIVITYQTTYFILYCRGVACCSCCKCFFGEDADLTDPQIATVYDLLHGVVGRDPREAANANEADARTWFLSQTIGQKVARCLLTIGIDILFFFAFYNAIALGVGWIAHSGSDLSVLETLGPIELWIATWFILSIYLSLDIDVRPIPPSMQCLRPYVMYLNDDESIRTTAYVFLRGFSKSTLAMFRLEATGGRIVTAFVIALVWILVPGVVRVVVGADGGGKFFPHGMLQEAVMSMITSFFLVFILVLGLQMQLMSGLEKYIEWMNDVSSMLDEGSSAANKVHYINLVRHNNTLSWVEMRTYLYTKGLIIFSRQEIFVVYVILLQVGMAMYILTRLMSSSASNDKTFGSPSFVGILLLFVVLTYSLLRILRTTRRIERLQSKQIALLAAQKFQIYYKRITWHPASSGDQQNELSDFSRGGDCDDDYDPDWADIDPRNLPRLKTNVIDDPDDDDSDDTDDIKEDAALLNDSDDDDAGFPARIPRHPTQLRLEKTVAADFNDAQSGQTVFSAEYLEQSEKFVQQVINICEAQDIIPRVFNIKVDVAVGLSLLCTVCAVIPTGVRLIFGDECGEWNN